MIQEVNVVEKAANNILAIIEGLQLVESNKLEALLKTLIENLQKFDYNTLLK